jgi:hypothetical protein
MKRKWLNTDPDSFRGKLYLLLIDKIVLGVAIGIAFVASDRWKLRDQRAYDDRTILAFQGASYVKELVPMVVDPKLGLPARAQALIALIETQSIGDKNALGLTELLLSQGLIRADYPEHLKWNRDDPLLDALETMMPPALEPLLEHYPVTLRRVRYRRFLLKSEAISRSFGANSSSVLSISVRIENLQS